MRQHFLVHEAGDLVGVAVQDLRPGQHATGRFMATGQEVLLEVRAAIPLGHKIALRDISAGEPVIEYGAEIGLATSDVPAGQHVHVHNLKGQRWV